MIPTNDLSEQLDFYLNNKNPYLQSKIISTLILHDLTDEINKYKFDSNNLIRRRVAEFYKMTNNRDSLREMIYDNDYRVLYSVASLFRYEAEKHLLITHIEDLLDENYHLPQDRDKLTYLLRILD